MSIVKKCGQFMQDDAGHVVKRAGKSFRLPSLPQKLKEDYPDDPFDSCFDFLGMLLSLKEDEEKCRAIDKRNNKRERSFQYKIQKERIELATLYYIGSLKKLSHKLQKSAQKKLRTTLAFAIKMQRAYHEYRS